MAKTPKQYPTLTVDQCIELRLFSTEFGRKWKDVLQAESWWKGLPMRGYPTLYGLRNSHGAEWLEGFDVETLRRGED